MISIISLKGNDVILFFILCKGNPREFPIMGAD